MFYKLATFLSFYYCMLLGQLYVTDLASKHGPHILRSLYGGNDTCQKLTVFHKLKIKFKLRLEFKVCGLFVCFTAFQALNPVSNFEEFLPIDCVPIWNSLKVFFENKNVSHGYTAYRLPKSHPVSYK